MAFGDRHSFSWRRITISIADEVSAAKPDRLVPFVKKTGHAHFNRGDLLCEGAD
jgi:hypothetical protein